MKVLVPVDSSKYATMCLKVASFICKPSDAEIYVMTVIPHISDIDLELSPSDREAVRGSFVRRGEALLEKSKKELESYGIHKITTVLLKGTSPAREILDFAEKEKMNLIVIGARGLNEDARFLLGSETPKVVKYSPCCFFVVRESCMEYCTL
jgi:nucleotide-binding universal stress UspA family protein